MSTTLEGAARRWKRRARKLPSSVNDAIVERRTAIVATARAQTPQRTGKLRKGWAFERAVNRVQLVNRVRYAGFAMRPQEQREVARKVAALLPSIQPAVVRRIKRTR